MIMWVFFSLKILISIILKHGSTLKPAFNLLSKYVCRVLQYDVFDEYDNQNINLEKSIFFFVVAKNSLVIV